MFNPLTLAPRGLTGRYTHGGGAGYSAPAVVFDGTNDYLSRGANPTGLVDGKEGILSAWFKMTGADGTRFQVSWDGTTDAFTIRRTTSNFFQIEGSNAANAVILRTRTITPTLIASGWVHLLASWNLATAVVQVYRNDVSDVFTNVNTNDDIDYASDGWTIGAIRTGTFKFNGDMADYYFDTNHMDLSVEANRRLFIDAAGKPVDLGSDGSTPTGTAPLMFFSGAVSAWHINKGTGGGFTEVGALTASSSSPSD